MGTAPHQCLKVTTAKSLTHGAKEYRATFKDSVLSTKKKWKFSELHDANGIFKKRQRQHSRASRTHNRLSVDNIISLSQRTEETDSTLASYASTVPTLVPRAQSNDVNKVADVENESSAVRIDEPERQADSESVDDDADEIEHRSISTDINHNAFLQNARLNGRQCKALIEPEPQTEKFMDFALLAHRAAQYLQNNTNGVAMQLRDALSAAMRCYHSLQGDDEQDMSGPDRVEHILRQCNLQQTFPQLTRDGDGTDRTAQICSLLLGTNHRDQKQSTERHNIDLLIWFGLYLYCVHALRGRENDADFDIADTALFRQHCAQMMGAQTISDMEFKVNFYVYSVASLSVKQQMPSLLLGIQPFVKRQTLCRRWRFNANSINDKYIQSLCSTFETPHPGMVVRTVFANNETFSGHDEESNSEVFSKIYTVYKLLKEPLHGVEVNRSDDEADDDNRSEADDEADDGNASPDHDHEEEDSSRQSNPPQRRRLNIESADNIQ